MPSRHKTPLLGWHPPAELAAWVRAEAVRRGIAIAEVLDEAVWCYRNRVEDGPVTIVCGQEGRANEGAIIIAREGAVVHLPGGGSLTVGRRGGVTFSGALRSAGDPGHRERDGDQGNANEPVQHGIDPS